MVHSGEISLAQADELLSRENKLTYDQFRGELNTLADSNRKQKDKPWVYRGDKNVRIPNAVPVGFELGSKHAQNADIQTFTAHVLKKKGETTSRFTSFSERLSVAKDFAGRSGPFVGKVKMSALRALEAAGTIKIWTPEMVRDYLKSGGEGKDGQKLADAVYSQMKKNGEILIEGQISAGMLRPVN